MESNTGTNPLAPMQFKVLPCIKCGGLERYKSGDCSACAKLMAKAWYSANKEKAVANMRAWQIANPEKFAASNKAWQAANVDRVKAYSQTDASKAKAKVSNHAYYLDNTEQCRAQSRAWHEANPLEGRIHQQNSRAKGYGSEGKMTKGLVSRLLESQGGLCACCNEPLGGDFHTDHIVALSEGGSNFDENIQLLRAGCNISKGTKDFSEFMELRKSLH